MRERGDARRSSAGPPRQVALAGNPNVGKSSLFNRLTGSRQHVANWPGKTIERRTGVCRCGEDDVELVDLPGTYSLAGLSPEEQAAAEALTDPGLAAVVVVVDATNLERNLYLAAQVAELGRPMVVVLNMVDAADRDGFVIDDARLSQALGAPVVRTVARSGQGLDALRRALVAATEAAPEPTVGPAEPPSVESTQEGGR
ncbi:MAG: FeoB small GTPase domain-containing protein [Egibacteraceae bacterium]